MLCRVYEAKRIDVEAVDAYQQVIALNGGTPQEIAAPSAAFARGGMRSFWSWRLQQLDESSERGFDSPTERARLHALLGDRERAMELLEKAFQNHDWTIYAAKVGYEFDSFRSNPRFQELIRKMNFHG